MNRSSSRPSIPRDWRDHLAHAINERDLTRIETLIDTGYQHNHTKFNDPLVADAAFLLQMAQENTLSRPYMHNSSSMRSPLRAKTNSRLAVEKKGGSMSWIAPPIASFVTGLHGSNNSINDRSNSNSSYHQNHNNPLGNTQSLRDRVSQLREMALFPDSTAHDMNVDPVVAGGGNNNNNNSSFRSSSSTHHHNHYSSNTNNTTASRLIHQHQMLMRKGTNFTSKSITEDAAAAMGVPALWIERPVGLTWDPTNHQQQNNKNNNNNDISTIHHQNNQHENSLSPGGGSKRRSFYPASSAESSPIRSVFEDPTVAGAALRLHSFIHSDEEPPVKSSRLYQAYVSMERSMPRNERENMAMMMNNGNNNNNNNKGVEVSISPARDSENGDNSNRGFLSDDHHTHHNNNTPSPHDRFLRKLNNEAVAPVGVELTRMLRFLAASEMMTRGTLEQEAQSEIHSSVASYRFGILHSRGISADRGTTQHHAFLDN